MIHITAVSDSNPSPIVGRNAANPVRESFELETVIRGERVRVDGIRFSRGGRRFRVQGVTYGPFAPGRDGTQFPVADQLREDFNHMVSAGINAIRVYHVPPRWLLERADEQGMTILIDI